jgi:O-antigen biosynthesis protein
MRICIATADIVGPIRNGGVGTAYTGLAEALADAGHAVHILYCSTTYEQLERTEVKQWYEARGIGFSDFSDLTTMVLGVQPSFGGPAKPVLNAYVAYEQLKNSSFDVIHFPDFLGLGFYCAMAKATGAAFTNTILVVTGHGPTMWSALTNDTPIDHPNLLFRDALERGMIANVDVLVTPNTYIKKWIQECGFRLPKYHACISGLLPHENIPTTTPAYRAGERVDEIVFYGRVETRKGIWQFLDALDELGRSGDLTHKKVAFLGKCAERGSGMSKVMLGLRARNWDFEWHLEESFDTFQALQYVSKTGRLAIMPSTCDNSPYAILEALTNGVPFIATGVGGVPELVHADSHKEVLVDPTSEALAARLRRAFREGAPVAKPAEPISEVRRHWVDFHDNFCAELLDNVRSSFGIAPPSPEKTVSVCIVHKDRPDYLRQAIKSINKQSYPNIETIVADNGSCDPGAIEYLERLEAAGTKLIRRKVSLYPSHARNDAVAAAAGDYVVFLDDDNLLKPNAVAAYVRALELGHFDIVVSCLDFFEGHEPPWVGYEPLKRVLFMGDAGVVGIFQNTMGDTNLIISRQTFANLGGFTDVGFFAPVEDWRFLLEAKRMGLRIGVMPEALVWYRRHAQVWRNSWRKKNQNGARRQALDAFLKGRPYDDVLITGYAQGLMNRVLEIEKRPLARYSDLGGENEQASTAEGTMQLDGEAAARIAVEQFTADLRWFVGQVILSAIEQRDLRMIVRFLWRARRRAGDKEAQMNAASGHASSVGWVANAVLKVRYSVRIPIQPAPDFDEQEYLARNPDVGRAVHKGQFSCGFAHYVAHGWTEQRARPGRLVN